MLSFPRLLLKAIYPVATGDYPAVFSLPWPLPAVSSPREAWAVQNRQLLGGLVSGFATSWVRFTGKELLLLPSVPQLEPCSINNSGALAAATSRSLPVCLMGNHVPVLSRQL